MQNNDTDSDELKKKKRQTFKKNIFCGNCGKIGHIFKNCPDPITSYGFIGVKIDFNKDNSDEINILNTIKKNLFTDVIKPGIHGIKYTNEDDIKNFSYYTDKIKFLLIRRRHSLGYMEFIRGHYKVDNINAIIYLFKQMVQSEIDKIGTNNFYDLWIELWGNDSFKDSEYKASKEKFERLKDGDDDLLNLDFYVNKVKPQWDFPEWGFPKGRRSFQESDIECAIRELDEETNLKKDNYEILSLTSPLEEIFIGTNGVQYRHCYYIFISNNSNDNLMIDPSNKIQVEEIGDIGWYTYHEIIEKFRPYHTERIKILSEVYITIINLVIDAIKANKKNKQD